MFLQSPPPPPPPSIVVCVLDDVSWPDLEAAQTPALDALRREGVTFTGFHAMPVCSATRVALWTGRLPRRMGIGEGISHFRPPGPTNPSPPPDLNTLPRLLHDAGYSTCLVGKWHAGILAVDGNPVPERSALDVGGFQNWLAGTPGNLRAAGGIGYRKWFRVDDGEGRLVKQYATEAQVRAAAEWWKNAAEPRFLAVCLNAPHPPFHAPPAEWRRGPDPDSREGRYRAMVESADIAVERLRVAVGEDTWFFVVSDNGTPPGGGEGSRRAKTTTFDRGVRVPLIVRGPGIPEKLRGTSTSALVSCTDLYATVAAIARVPVPRDGGGEDSSSFLDALRGVPFEGRSFVMAERYGSNPENQGEGDDLMVRDARWKLRLAGGHEELYDLLADPAETAPMATAALEGEAAQALARLRAFLDSLPPRPPHPGRGHKSRRHKR